MKKIIVLGLAALAAVSCSKSNTATVNATITGADQKEIIVSKLAVNQLKTVDTVKTNGSGNLPHLPNVNIVAAVHRLEQPPKNFDEVLIVDKIQSSEKIAYCEEHGIPYKVIGYNKENPDGAAHNFKYCAFINPAGHQTGCCADPPIEDIRKDGRDYRRIDIRPLVVRDCCAHCKAGIDAWRFL